MNGDTEDESHSEQDGAQLNEGIAKIRNDLLLDSVRIPNKFQFEITSRERELKKANEWLDLAAKDIDAYARDFIAPPLRHVLLERNLRAVKLFNAYNEPLQYGPFSTPNNEPDAFVHYVDMYRAIHAELKKAHLYPDRIRLAGVDCIHPSRFPVLDFIARGVDIDPYIDVYTIHHYFHRFDWMALVPFLQGSFQDSMDRQTPKVVEYCKRRGKPLLAAETGWYPNDGDPMPTDPLAQPRHHAALTTAETLVRGMNAGLSGFAIWSLFNPGTFDGAWQVVWVRNGRLYKAQHLYPMYRLFTRYARPGSNVFPLRPEDREWPWQYLHGTALVTPEGKAVLYVINDNLVESRKVKLMLSKEWVERKLRKVIKDNARMGTDSGVVEPKGNGERSVLEELLTPMSLTAFVEYD